MPTARAAAGMALGAVPGAVAGALAAPEMSGDKVKWTGNPAQMVRNVASDPMTAAKRFGNTFGQAAHGAWDTGLGDTLKGGYEGVKNIVTHPIDTAKALGQTGGLLSRALNPIQTSAQGGVGKWQQSVRDVGSGLGFSGAQHWFHPSMTPTPETAPTAPRATPTPSPAPPPTPAPPPIPKQPMLP